MFATRIFTLRIYIHICIYTFCRRCEDAAPVNRLLKHVSAVMRQRQRQQALELQALESRQSDESIPSDGAAESIRNKPI